MYPNAFYRVTVKALVKDTKGRVLVVKENQDTWSLPGGGLDHGEDPELGLRRELNEELGIENATIHGIKQILTFELIDKQAWLLWIVYDVSLHTSDFTPGIGVSYHSFIHPDELRTSNDVFEQLVYKVACSS